MIMSLFLTLLSEFLGNLPLAVQQLVVAGILLWFFALLFLIAFSEKATTRIIRILAVLQRAWYRRERRTRSR